MATKELGEFDQKEWSGEIVKALRAIKADEVSLKLQNQFFRGLTAPVGYQNE